jgi:epoxyqueuosine reductase
MIVGMSHVDMRRLADDIKSWGRELGFSEVGIAGIDLGRAEARLMAWLAEGLHGTMDYMVRHGATRARPDELVPGTLRVISARMDYLPEAMRDAEAVLADPALGYVARYALGRDYHKLMRTRLQRLCGRIAEAAGPFGHRVFSDSAPVMEVELARLAGTGWRGKHTLLLSRAGSWFFLGEVYTDLPLPVDRPVAEHCGTCRACIDICPTGAIVAPYVLDARRCISYLTIEHAGPIPVELRPLLGNRIYGCDDCQLACPWNRHARLAAEPDFQARHGLDHRTLVELAAWDERTFARNTEGMALRRIGHERWLRNIAVALGNAPPSARALAALDTLVAHSSGMVAEHANWARERLNDQGRRGAAAGFRP